ncbi:sciellin isoform X5 [Rana temporaria]|uniref:sciellin isoform X5 n=1 Tax=Rana temporaria TaxID=8407 RepID=UPI001AACA29A|nr:sciellin isoform X5 [Rana temporaria]
MSTYTFNKYGSDAKSNTLGSVSRENVIQDVNKRRTLLKDSSWIKSRPEDEEDKMKEENFGKSLLNKYKSQENLDKDNDKEEKATIHNRFKSDDALDRISLRNTSERGNKSATLERMPMSESDTINKRQSWAPSNKTTTTTTTTTEESKRKSWAPTNRNTTITTTTETKPAVSSKPDGQKITIYSSDARTTDMPTRTNFIDSARSRFEKTEEKPSPPTSPPARIGNRPAYPSKPVTSDSGERRSAVERKQRSQDLDNLIDVSSSRVVKSKGSQDLDNLIEVSNPKVVSSRGTQNVDNLIDIKSTVDKGVKRTQNVDNLIDIKSTVDKGVKSRAQNLDNLIDIKPTANKGVKSDQLDGLIEISDTAKNTRKREDQLSDFIDIKKPEAKSRTQKVDNLIEIKNTNTASTNKGPQNLDNLIDIKNTNTISTNKGPQNLDSLIDIKNTNTISTNKGPQNLDNLIDIKNTNTISTNKGNQDLDDFIAIAGERNKGTPKYPANSSNTTSRSSTTTTTTTYNVTSDNSDAPSRRSSSSRTYNVTNDSQDSPFRGSTTTTTYKLSDDNSEAPSRRPTTTTTTTYKDINDGPSARSNVNNYTQDSWKSSPNTYGQSIVSNSIKTVYSTSDRSVIEKDLCTYCRKPLGIDAKMILKDLSISCHATCFKCEACSGSLGNLKAGDSMWIYKQTIHCEPCYFSAREKWII